MHLDFSAIFLPQYRTQILHGIEFTVWLTVSSWILAIGLGTVLATMRMSGNKIAEYFVAIYIAFHRNVPVLVHILLWYFGVATLLPANVQVWTNAHNGEVIFSSIAIGLCMAAYFSEDIRSGLRSIPWSQHEASRSLGLTYLGSMRYVILPQAFRIALPPFINHTVLLFKNTSLAMAIGAAEVTYAVQEIENHTFRTFETYLVGTVFYLVVSLGLMFVGAVVGRTTRIPSR
ncbi:amino acid ABC transporter permease [Paraburkholderia sediminicola]|uniref:amino acid ABC transporter permease n=1 Tax=Paraburkholderia sediminicola TaxID=458836 RepID=UPI0038B8F803